MTLQEAYNRGLTDAENGVIEAIKQVLYLQPPGAFANPELQQFFSIFANEYLALKNKEIENIGVETTDNPSPSEDIGDVNLPKIDCSELEKRLISILKYEKYSPDSPITKSQLDILDVVSIRSEAYAKQFDTRTSEGKARKKLIQEQIELLTNQ